MHVLQAATANKNESYEEAMKYHKRAQKFNLCAGIAIIFAITYTGVIVLYVVLVVVAIVWTL